MPTPKTGAPGATDQKPRGEGPPENRPPGYLPAEDNPSIDPAHQIWEQGGRTGIPEDHWCQAQREIDALDQPSPTA